MNLNRKSFLKHCGTGLAGLGLGRLSASTSSAGSSVGVVKLPTFNQTNQGPYWSAVRAGYDFEDRLHYFNTGGLGAVPTAVRQYTERMTAEMESIVETGHGRLDPARVAVADFMGCGVDEVSFVRNTTEGNGIVAGGLELERGDEVIFESHAHPGGSFPWLLQAQTKGVAVRLFEPDPESVEGNVKRIEALITKRTKVVQVSHVTAPTGVLMPVE